MDSLWHLVLIWMGVLAASATAVSLTMVSLREEGLQHSPVATRIMTSAVPIATGVQEASVAARYTGASTGRRA